MLFIGTEEYKWVPGADLQLNWGPPTNISSGSSSGPPARPAAPPPAAEAERGSGSGGSMAASSSGGITIHPAEPGYVYTPFQKKMINAIRTNTPFDVDTTGPPQESPSAACPAERPGGSWEAFQSKVHIQLPSVENSANVVKQKVLRFFDIAKNVFATTEDTMDSMRSHGFTHLTVTAPGAADEGGHNRITPASRAPSVDELTRDASDHALKEIREQLL